MQIIRYFRSKFIDLSNSLTSLFIPKSESFIIRKFDLFKIHIMMFGTHVLIEKYIQSFAQTKIVIRWLKQV